MSSSLGFSDFTLENNLEDKFAKKKHNKTIKKRESFQKKKITRENMDNFLNLMKSVGNDAEKDGSGLADFNPPPKPLLTKQPDEDPENSIDNAINPKEFKELDESAANEVYYKKFVPYYSEAQNNVHLSGNKDKLFEKLNYMIHLLEENKDQKTQNVTEELVLYMFLGVFIIFVVDSFARSTKYVR